MSTFKNFFKVKNIEEVLSLESLFPQLGTEEIPLLNASGRVLASDIISDADLPGFDRSTMDGFAVVASSTFGASDGSPAFLNIKGTVPMGEEPDFSIRPGEAARMPTGGMLPEGADSVIMIELTEAIDDDSIEIYKSVAPGNDIIKRGEDYKAGDTIISAGCRLRPQDVGLLAAFGQDPVSVFKQPVVGIISTGDEIVPVNKNPGSAEVRDTNTYSLAGFVKDAGAIPVTFGIAKDNFDELLKMCSKAIEETDMVILSGGSSVGTRDFTIEVLSSLPESEILVHGISISPGKPTILAKTRGKAVWGLPGHVVSSMIVFKVIVRPFIEHIGGVSLTNRKQQWTKAKMTRNISSAQGRIDCIRVKLSRTNRTLFAEPVLGKSGLINTMVKADGIVMVDINSEGIEEGAEVDVIQI
ncbi:MAG: molybdopterin molybdotransferase MoeA [Deltaproteobacteria bacterium]|nr:molybdopterin molybdotransferase MoeA [Deltaproteobacteria bacterium]MBW2219082.1 molybdopterin molybdotransferase MoeA [Deltaproteobacteria bacterium]